MIEPPRLWKNCAMDGMRCWQNTSATNRLLARFSSSATDYILTAARGWIIAMPPATSAMCSGVSGCSRAKLSDPGIVWHGSVMTDSTRIALASRPHGEPTADDFRTETRTLPAVEDGQVLLRTIYLSLDPYMRGRMSDAKSYAAPMDVGDTVVGATVCEVIESRTDHAERGDIVLAYTGWQTHAIASDGQFRVLDPDAAPLSAWLGVLGMPGFTAYAGLLKIGRPQPGETVAVAAATGPVGSAVGQIARIKGARAVGIAGGNHKVEWLREAGFDAALDHRSPSF